MDMARQVIPDIFPLTYCRGMNYYHLYTKSGLKLCTININLDNPENIAKILTTGANEYVDKNKDLVT